MYTEPEPFKELVRAFTDRLASRPLALLLVRVELTLALAEALGLDDEPITVGWILLSRMPLRYPVLEMLTSEQRRMHANASHLAPYSSRFAWESALARYIEIPTEHRLYEIEVKGRSQAGKKAARLDEQVISACRKTPAPDALRPGQYRELLRAQLPFQQRAKRYPKATEPYRVSISLEGGLAQGTVKFSDDLVQRKDQIDEEWLRTPRVRQPIEVRISDLRSTAEWLDEREEALGKRIHWVNDFDHLRFRGTHHQNDHTIIDPDDDPVLVINGVFNLVGMVASGKTTLAKLLVAYTLRAGVDFRITLVVGDTNTAIQTAHEFNQWFECDPAENECIAIPLLGASQRETHLHRLLASREYQESKKRGQPHWGERWLNPVCPLMHLIQWDSREVAVVPAGAEPCERLKNVPTRPKEQAVTYLCPLFAACPSKQLYRDMPGAKLWVTTPGALSQGALPRHLDARIGKLGDLVYEQSDLVIVDEVETVVDWFDRAFAQIIPLTNGDNGLFDRLDVQVAEYLRANRALDTEPRRWMLTLRESIKALTAILSSINNETRGDMLRRWVKRGYFTPNGLAYRLARRLAGLKEWDDNETPMETRRDNADKTDEIFKYFDILLNRSGDLLRVVPPDDPKDAAAILELAQIVGTINNVADDVTDEAILEACRLWIEHTIPDIEARLEDLKLALEASTNPADQTYLEKQIDPSVDTLALRLQFMLNVALLDRHADLVFNQWHHKPEEIGAEKPFSRIPRGMEDILPLPLTGRQYGLYTVPMERPGQSKRRSGNHLSMFAYTNIGRSYLLNFHRLREDLDGRPGPNVLMMSGTSYLPDSTPYHVPIRPQGVLLPSPEMIDALNESRFVVRFCTNDKGRPIKVSGVYDKISSLRQMIGKLLQHGGTPGGFFGEVLDTLTANGLATPNQWRDRSRLLLLTNSYAQAEIVGQMLREGWRERADSIYHLKRGREGEDYLLGKSLARVDIEQFAGTGGRILIAPMGSIGRGFNILNEEKKAAFGAVFFLIRPMWHPGDMSAIAQELNRYALEWAADPQFSAWIMGDSLHKRALLARQSAENLRRAIERRSGYADLENDEPLKLHPRDDLAATTAGRVIQAVGRLLRGGVPFYAYFTDAAWAPETAKADAESLEESGETSLLKAMIDIVCDYAHEDEIGRQLYLALADALASTEIYNGY